VRKRSDALRQRHPNPRNFIKPHEDVWRRTTVAERARVLHGIAELPRRDREEVARLECRDTGKPLSRTHVDATMATRYVEFYANSIESFYADPHPGPRRQVWLVAPARVLDLERRAA
jgi:acyl-CoA reductase-like NAD-dependent aldehyde dehydrogenase